MTGCFRNAWYIGIGLLCLASSGQAVLLGDQKPPNATDYSFANGRLEDGENLVNEESIDIYYAQEHYRHGVEALNGKNWREAAKRFNNLVLNFSHTSFAQEAGFFLGVSFYNLSEYDFANNAFTAYLKSQSNPRYFWSLLSINSLLQRNLGAVHAAVALVLKGFLNGHQEQI